jgi:hypothetical protein
MLLNLRGKNHTIRHKVYTSEALENVSNLFDQWYGKLINEAGGDATECLYEIRVGKNFYSGLNKSEFLQEFNHSGSAEYVRILLRKEPSNRLQDQPDPRSNNVQMSLVLDKNGESYFNVGGDNAQWVDSVSSQFLDCNERVPNRNRLMNSRWLEMVVQVAVSVLLTIVAIFAANSAGQYIEYPYSAIYVFVVTFIFLSNIWGFILQALKDLRTRLYPVVDIRSAPRKRYSPVIAGFVLLVVMGWAIEHLLDLMLIHNKSN